MRIITLLTFCLATVILLFWLHSKLEKEVIRYSGNAMGTTYNITAIFYNNRVPNFVENTIKKTLKDINDSLSNWNEISEVSILNNTSENQPLKASKRLYHVIQTANDIHEKSNGLFDISAAPLINLWGFGPTNTNKQEPSAKDIKRALSQMGKVEIDETQHTLIKKNADLKVNVSALAKGYGIDEIARNLSALGIENFMVEIGGDLITKGTNPKGDPWHVGIEQPDHINNDIQKIVKLSNQALATSGDYRNYFEKDNKRYSHIINPKTGYPVDHKTVSVTVIAKNAMLADAWATTLLVAGAEEGLKLADQNQIAAFFISKTQSANYKTSMSEYFLKTQSEN